MHASVRRTGRRYGRAAPWVIAVASLALGCGASQQQRRHDALSKTLAQPQQKRDDGAGAGGTRVQARLGASASAPAADDGQAADSPFVAPVLTRAVLVRAVLDRNPSLEAARESARAALAEHGRQTAIEDPMLEYALAPLSLGGDADLGHSLRITQRLPWPGKRAAAGEVVLAEAEAAASERQGTHVELAAMASMLFDRLWMSERALSVNAQYASLLSSTLRSVRDALAVGGASQAEVLMVELEEAMLARERLRIEAERADSTARLNALLHRAPDAPLPPPAADDPVAASRVDEATSTPMKAAQLASAARPELAAQRQRIRAARDQVTLAERERYPDLLLMGEYTSMNMDPAHRLMVGVGIELPLQQGARDASVDAARARMRAAEHELEALSDRVQSEAHGARARVLEAERTVALYGERLVPIGRAQLEAEGLAHANGTASLTSVLQAERQLRGLELEAIEATAMLGERRAQLAAALGRLPIELEETP